METKVLEIIKDESERADVRKYTCINGFGYSQFERNIADRVVKLFAIPDVSNSEVFEHYGKPFTSGRDLWDFLTTHYNFTPKT